MTDVAELTAFLDVLADAAAAAIMPHFRARLPVESKRRDAFDPVTVADRTGETAMRALINRTYPHHGIVGEEHGAERADADYVWVLDPIDGTRAFITGVPVWGILIGLAHQAPPILGMMYPPFPGGRVMGNGAQAYFPRGGAPTPLGHRPWPKRRAAP